MTLPTVSLLRTTSLVVTASEDCETYAEVVGCKIKEAQTWAFHLTLSVLNFGGVVRTQRKDGPRARACA